MAILSAPTYALQPSAQQVPTATNYMSSFSFLNQYLPDTYEQEFERYGNRSVASFLRMVSAELPCASDQIKWGEQGRLHIKYTNCTLAIVTANKTATLTIPVNANSDITTANQNPLNTNAVAAPWNPGVGTASLRVGQTILLQKTAGANSSTTVGLQNKAIVTAVTIGNGTAATTADIAFYESTVNFLGTSGGSPDATERISVFIYGSEFKKGQNGMVGSLEAQDNFFTNNPIILKDNYTVNGSDMAFVGWVEVTDDAGKPGYLWYLKSQHETRMRFDDYLETSMLEAVPAETNSGAIAASMMGSQGVFYVVNNRGNVWGAGNPSSLSDWDSIVARLDQQGAIEENVVFHNRSLGFAVDNMLASVNGGTTGGSGTTYSASFGLFENDTQMALNLGFSGFRRGYDFYKTDWRYLNDPTMRGGMNITNTAVSTAITGLLVPAGSTNIYDQVLGQNLKRPFLHVRYRASEMEDRKYKTWITGSAGGAQTSDLDAMTVNFLSERCVCTLGANNFLLFRYG